MRDRYTPALLRASVPPLTSWVSARQADIERVTRAALDVSALRAAFRALHAEQIAPARTSGEGYFRVAYRAGYDGRPYADVAPYALLAALDSGVTLRAAYDAGVAQAALRR